jgi:hypothetical protein
MASFIDLKNLYRGSQKFKNVLPEGDDKELNEMAICQAWGRWP